MGCDYRKTECSNEGIISDGVWVCSKHLLHKKDAKDERIAALEAENAALRARGGAALAGVTVAEFVATLLTEALKLRTGRQRP